MNIPIAVWPEEAKRLGVKCCGVVRSAMSNPFQGTIHLMVTTSGGYVQQGDEFPKPITKQTFLSQNWDTGGSLLQPFPVREVEDGRESNEANSGK